MPRPPSDEEFADLVRASWPSLYRTAYLLLGEPHLAEDLVQTALARTYAAWGRVRDTDRATGYARTVLLNTATDWFRKRSWRREIATEDPPPDRAAGGEHDGPDDGTRSLVLDALRSLAPRQRAVVVLRFYEDASVAETARLLGCSEGTVKSQTSDALARLRVLLGDAVVPAHLTSAAPTPGDPS